MAVVDPYTQGGFGLLLLKSKVYDLHKVHRGWGGVEELGQVREPPSNLGRLASCLFLETGKGAIQLTFHLPSLREVFWVSPKELAWEEEGMGLAKRTEYKCWGQGP